LIKFVFGSELLDSYEALTCQH